MNLPRLLFALPLLVFVGSVSQSGYELVSVTCTSHYLKAYNKAKTFEEARKHCQEDGGDLVMDDRGREWHDTIARYMKKSYGDSPLWVWLGATDSNLDGVWTWVDGSPMTSETFWFPGEPNGAIGREECLQTRHNRDRGYNWEWNDIECSNLFPFVCEMKIN